MSIYLYIYPNLKRYPHGVMAKVQNWVFKLSEFELH